MAQISLSPSTQDGSSIDVSNFCGEGDCLAFRLHTKLAGDVAYGYDVVHIHGTLADIRLLVGKLLDAIGPEPQTQNPQPFVEVLQVDGTGTVIYHGPEILNVSMTTGPDTRAADGALPGVACGTCYAIPCVACGDATIPTEHGLCAACLIVQIAEPDTRAADELKADALDEARDVVADNQEVAHV